MRRRDDIPATVVAGVLASPLGKEIWDYGLGDKSKPS